MAPTVSPMASAPWTTLDYPQMTMHSKQPLDSIQAAMISTTLRVRFPEGTCPKPELMCQDFCEYGELARLDMTLKKSSGAVLVTYFDVRSAQRCSLQIVSAHAEPWASLQQDYRALRISLATSESIGSMGGFNQFGEVANVSVISGEMVVEFFDMRAAQALLEHIEHHGGNASPHWPVDEQERSLLRGWTPTTPQTQAKQRREQHLQQLQHFHQVQQGSPMNLHALAAGLFGANPELHAGGVTPVPRMQPSPLPLELSSSTSHPSALSVNPSSPTASGGAVTSSVPGPPTLPAPPPGLASGQDKIGSKKDDEPPSPNSDDSPTRADRNSRPVRTKVTIKEFAKYDIETDKINSGEDRRTTVMVRNLSGPRARKEFLDFLHKCDLALKFTFFYMPCKEHRNTPAGFAFVNFMHPEDVMKLYIAMKSGLWKEVMSDAQSKAPAMSYARFQGQEALLKHFSSSAVLHESDPDKRPIFRTKAGHLQEMSPSTILTSSPNRSPVRSPVRSPNRSPRKNRGGYNMTAQVGQASEVSLASVHNGQDHTSQSPSRKHGPKATEVDVSGAVQADTQPSYVYLSSIISQPSPSFQDHQYAVPASRAVI